MRLNLGCGQNKLPGYINVDKYNNFSPEIVHDLEIFPWPFEDSSISEIVMHHVLEHIGADTNTFLSIIKEVYRISQNGCYLKIAVPHPRSYGFESDPSHVRIITPQIMSLFSLKNNLEWAKNGWPNTPLATYLAVDFEITNVTNFLTPYWLEELQAGRKSEQEINFAVDSYFNVIDQVQIDLRVIKTQ